MSETVAYDHSVVKLRFKLQGISVMFNECSAWPNINDRRAATPEVLWSSSSPRHVSTAPVVTSATWPPKFGQIPDNSKQTMYTYIHIYIHTIYIYTHKYYIYIYIHTYRVFQPEKTGYLYNYKRGSFHEWGCSYSLIFSTGKTAITVIASWENTKVIWCRLGSKYNSFFQPDV